MIPIWLHEAASRYNSQSLANQDAYADIIDADSKPSHYS